MSADYDLVILGGTLEGRLAALSAVGYGARVALVEPPGVFAQRQQVRYLRQGLQQLAEGREQQAVAKWFTRSDRPAATDFGSAFDSVFDSAFDWRALVEWSAIAAETQMPLISAAALSVSGVDVIFALPNQILSRPAVIAADRTLSSRAILAAFGTVPRVPEPHIAGPRVSGESWSGPLTTGLEPLLQAEALPSDISILGDSFEAIAWAQGLSSLGANVTLVTDRFLRHEDSEMRAVVRSHLMAAGIQLINAANVDFASTAAFTASVVLPLGRQQAALSLPGFVYQQRDRYRHIDIRIPERPYLPINSRLQTAHPRIFACGSLVRGRNDALSLAKYETQIAVWNALFVPLKRVDDSRLTRGSDRFASAGVVPEFAKQGRPPIKAYEIWRAAVPNSAELNQVSPLPLYCQLICKHGRLQSIALVGKGAGELIEAIASMIGQPIAALIKTSAPVPPIANSLMDVVRVAAEEAVQASGKLALSTRWQPGQWRRDWAENWFNWRRSR